MSDYLTRSSFSGQCNNLSKDVCIGMHETAFQTWLKAKDIMSDNIATVSPQCTVVEAAKIMWRNSISCLVISDNGKLSGIITETDMVKRTIFNGSDFNKIKVTQIMSSPVRTIPCHLSIMEISEIMKDENIRRLVVQSEGIPVGIITQTDMVRSLAFYTQSKEVSEIMTPDVSVIAQSATVREAADQMASQDISCLVIMDGNIIAGIFTERDLTRRVIAAELLPDETPLEKVLSSPVVTVAADYSVLSAQKLMERARIRRLIVTEYENSPAGQEILLGMITQTDILESLRATLQEEERNYFSHLIESDESIYAVDSDLNTIYVSPSFIDLLDVMDSTELVNKPFLPKQFWQDSRHRSRLLARLTKANLCVEELALQTAKGKKLSVLLFSTPTRSLRGEICGRHGMLCRLTPISNSEQTYKVGTTSH